jgi:hypothetical protein
MKKLTSLIAMLLLAGCSLFPARVEVQIIKDPTPVAGPRIEIPTRPPLPSDKITETDINNCKSTVNQQCSVIVKLLAATMDVVQTRVDILENMINTYNATNDKLPKLEVLKEEAAKAAAAAQPKKTGWFGN